MTRTINQKIMVLLTAKKLLTKKLIKELNLNQICLLLTIIEIENHKKP